MIHRAFLFFQNLFPFTIRVLKRQVRLSDMFNSSCQFIFSSLECIIELAERSFFVCYRSICLSKFLREGVPYLGWSASNDRTRDTGILTLSCSST